MPGDISNDQRHQILALHQHTSKSNRQIATDLNISRRCVDKILKKWRESGSLSADRSGKCGRRPKLSIRDKAVIVRECKKDPTKTARQIQRSAGGIALSVSLRCVQRILHQYGLVPYRPVPVPLLNRTKKHNRWLWAQQYENWSENNWAQVSATVQCMS